MEEMNATVLEVAKNASQATDTAEQAKRKAQEGSSIVAKVVAGIGEVQNQSLELKTDMTTLGAQAQGIGHIMAPLADFANVNRDLVVTAYQSASGIVNLVTPTSAVVMALCYFSGIVPFTQTFLLPA